MNPHPFTMNRMHSTIDARVWTTTARWDYRTSFQIHSTKWPGGIKYLSKDNRCRAGNGRTSRSDIISGGFLIIFLFWSKNTIPGIVLMEMLFSKYLQSFTMTDSPSPIIAKAAPNLFKVSSGYRLGWGPPNSINVLDKLFFKLLIVFAAFLHSELNRLMPIKSGLKLVTSSI